MKLNKKGFTLAELLIVVAIIAVLIAIAIPTFSGALDNAKLQTDHANMRNAYAMAKTIELTGYVSGDMLGAGGTDTKIESASTQYFYMPDGTLGTSSSGAYELKINPTNTNGCTESQVCNAGTPDHTAAKYIVINIDTTNKTATAGLAS